MKWCLDCGAIQSGASSCRACGGSHRPGLLGFSDLYEAYADPLRRFVRRLADDRGLPESQVDTEGVVHDTFVVLLSGSGQPIRNPGAWLFTVARNQVSKAAAPRRQIAPGDPADHSHGGRAAWSTLASQPADAEDVRAAREVMHVIAGLPDHQRIATYLRQVEGWSLAEIGAYLNCAASTAGVHISRGTTKVRSWVGGVKFSIVLPDRSRPPVAIRRRRALRSAILATAGPLAGILLVAVIAGALGMPWWLAAVTSAGAGAAFLAVASRRLRAEASAWRRQRRFNRWLRTGRPLGSPAGTRRS